MAASPLHPDPHPTVDLTTCLAPPHTQPASLQGLVA